MDAETLEKTLSTQQNIKIPKKSIPSIKRSGLRNIYPLSSAQKRIFILHEMAIDKSIYNCPLAIKIQGQLDKNTLKKALEYLVKRHAALRTTFEMLNNELVQVIHDEIAWKVQFRVDPLFDIQSHLKDWITPFELSKAPLFRIELIQKTENTFFLLFDIHHIVSDARSFSILIEELACLYENQSLSPLEISYGDYAIWQNELIHSEYLQKEKDFWIKSFSHNVSKLRISKDFVPSETLSQEGDRLFFSIDPSLTTALRTFAKEKKVTLYMLLLAIYANLLHLFSGNDEIVIGSSIEGRTHPDFRKIFGVFINMLPLKCLTNPITTFNQHLIKVRKTCLEAFQNQHYPFEELVKCINDRSGNENPLFQTLFDFHKGTRGKIYLKDLSFEEIPFFPKVSKFDFSLEATEGENSIELFFEYNVHLFSKETIQSLADGFVNISKEITQNSEVRIGEICCFLPEKSREILNLFDFPCPDIPYDESFQKIFKGKVIEFPNSIAAEDDQMQITYDELDKVTTALSFHLRNLGVKPGDIVATRMERSVDLLIGMIAILKAGAAYLPIDPDYPASRADLILKDSQAKLLLSNREISHGSIKAFNLYDLLALPGLSLPDLDVSEDMLAYVIYTSGSTGSPKGAMLSHKGMINHIYSKIEVLNLTEEDVIAQTSSQTFDVSIWQFLTILFVGGKVVIFNQDDAWVPQLLISKLEKKKISIFETVPSHMHLILDAFESNSFPLKALRYLILNGEPLPSKICSKWYFQYPLIPIINAYGPTECSDDTCHYLVKGDEKVDVQPIGGMISNIQGYVLNSLFNFVPPNVPGELYIGGVGLARGYIGQPDLTASIFLPSPFSQKGERIYRTKDLAKYSLDGNIEYLGRVDRQVKIQGVRIELEEVENVLKQHPEIQQSVVVIKKNPPQGEFLIAYLIPEKNQKDHEKLTSDLRSYLKQKLPSAMIPNRFLFLEHFPLNPSGKINLKALPEPDYTFELKKEINLPTNKIEVGLAALWKGLLKTDLIERTDNFFEKGGNSLLALQLASQIRKEFSVEMSLQRIFTHPNLVDLATYIAKNSLQGQKLDTLLPVILSDIAHRFEPFPLTHVQNAYLLGRSGIFELGNVSVHIYSEYEKSDLDLNRLEIAFNKLIQRHEALRLIFPGNGTQKILNDVPYYSITCKNLSNASQDEILNWIDENRKKLSHEVFKADSWPLFSIEAAIFPNNIVRLYLSFDALILDGWSVNTFALEWKKLYDNPAISIEPLEVSFRDYVLATDEIKKTAIYQRDKEYWLSRVSSFPLAPQLPINSLSTSDKKQKFARSSGKIHKDIWKQCLDVLKIKGISPTAFVASVFSEVLAKYAVSDHFTLNLTLFDRLPLHPQINDILGDFTSIILLEVDRRKLLRESFFERAKFLQKQLWNDLDHHLFSGIEFLQHLSRQHKDLPLGSLMPVVLTSILGVEDNDYDIEQFLGKEAFSISQTPQVWLDYKAYEVEGNLIIEWDYVEGLFAPNFIPSMHSYYCDLLHLLATDISAWERQSFSFLPEKEKNFWEEYNSTTWDVNYRSIHELIWNLGKTIPNNTAVISSEGPLTYETLMRKANQVANYLKKSGVLPNQLVGIVMEKGWEQIIGCLGILISGAAYLPIDPNVPSSRIDELFTLGEVGHILTQKKWVSKIKATPFLLSINEKKLTTLDECFAFSEDDLTFPKTLNDLVYVIFTSGSTGKPKGVMIEQKSLLNTLLDINDRFSISSTDKVLSLSNLNFDLSVFDIFGMLIAGGTIIFPDNDKIKDPIHWVELIIKHKITIWNSVPMFMMMLIEYLETASEEIIGKLSKTLRCVLLSGDWIPVDLPKKIHRFFDSNPNLKIISLGGATEASIWSIIYEIPPNETFLKSIPYGYPLRNQHIYVLTSQLELVPPGGIGDLYIGGIGVARGYWKDQEKTNLSFFDHPEYGRIYKTGDLGRLQQENGIEFHGRNDFQVKISGHRIELGEIESILNKHKDVHQAIVVAIEETPYSKKLHGCIVPKKIVEGDENFSPSISDLQERTLFTLAQKGRRSFSKTEFPQQIQFKSPEGMQKKYFSRKSYRRFDNKKLEKRIALDWLKSCFRRDQTVKNASDNFLSQDKLYSVLNVLAALNSPSHSLPKYRFPSAGSLYPVQTYVSIPKNLINDVEGGTYYFDPQENLLIKISSYEGEEKEIRLYFVAKSSAIEPLYGILSNDFCLLEAGYMSRLIHDSCKAMGLNFKTMQANTFNSSAINLHLDEGDKIISCLQIATNKEAFEFDKRITFYLYVKKGSITHVEQGLYSFDIFDPALENPLKMELEVSPIPQDTYSIFEEAGCALFFILPKSLNDEERRKLLIQVGYIAQSLMDNGIECQIGMCPIGHIQFKNKVAFEEVIVKGEICHTLFIGGVDKNQIESFETSKPREDVFETTLKAHLSENLPNYMIPNSFTFVERVPLTSNGKVDQKAIESLVPKYNSTFKGERTLPRNEIEVTIVEIWKEVLQISEIGIHDNFFDLGGQSLLMTKAALKIRESFELDLPLKIFFELTTVASLGDFVNQSIRADNASEIDIILNDAKLDSKINLNVPRNPFIRNPSGILLTGPTGFLGAHLLEELLRSTSAKIYCLVRAENQNEGKKRLETCLKRYQIEWDSFKDERVVIVCGDLDKPGLGCANNIYDELADSVDLIYHCGAFVHHIYNYQMLRNSNVLGTAELIKLATLSKEKGIFYVSTLVAANEVDAEGQLEEAFPKDSIEGLASGYQLSKWASEHLLRQAHERSLPVMIFRPSTITGHEKTGVCSFENDHFLRLVKGCIQLGYAPFSDEEIDLLPVNFVSNLIVNFSLYGEFGKVFNITSPHKISWVSFIDWLNRSGYSVSLLEPNKWKSLLSKISSENALFPLLSIYLSEDTEHFRNKTARNLNTLSTLKKLNKAFPTITDERLEIYFKYLEDHGF